MFTSLITATELRARLQQPHDWLIFDCSADLSDPGAGDRLYEQARIPGALRAHLERDLSAHAPGAPTASGGRHPLPTRENVARWLGSMGLRPGQQVVVYDRQGAQYCGRLWWMLRWCGHEAVAVLDGGWNAWVAAGGDVASGPVPAHAVSASAYPLKDPLARLVVTPTVWRSLGAPNQVVVDARGRVRYLGETEPLDPVAGHIPGALNRPFTDNFEADGRFKTPEALRAEWLELLAGRDPATVVHHCGSGVTAVPNLLAMEIAGLGGAALYAGSWSEWCTTPGLPCARGAPA